MVQSHDSDNQNFWFGVSMFLIGLIAGVIMTSASGSASFLKFGTKTAASKPPSVPAVPAQAQPASAANQPSAQDRMIQVAKDIGLNESDFKGCISSDKFKQRIDADLAGGSDAGVNGTPGNILYNIKTKNALLISGARPVDSFKKYIDAMLNDPNYQSKDADVTSAKNVPVVDASTDHIRGNPDAELAIIEYVDYQCPFCQRVHPTMQQLLTDYGDKVMWVMRNFPLGFHPDALPLATGAECAADQGGNDAYWDYADKILGTN